MLDPYVSGPVRNALLLPVLFSLTLFLSAGLLFSVQPMVAKMLLPFLGGTPAVWNTCLVFFQALLLAGYSYAHFTTTRLKLQKQVALHLGLLLAAAAALPIQLSDTRVAALSEQSNPSLWLLGSLLASVGLPFFILSTAAPLLQKWFAGTEHPSARDPYFLYAASNLGSLIALLGYPGLIEPYLRVRDQSRIWSAGYAIGALLILLCAAVAWRNRGSRTEFTLQPGAADQSAGVCEVRQKIAPERRFRWLALAFVPSSLMLGVTTYITTDIASIPLLWVLPLSLYLLTFILVFSTRTLLPGQFFGQALPICAVALAYLLLSEATEPPWLLIGLHLLFFFMAAMVCHGRLAEDRPPSVHLTEFYLWISLGGVLGGLFNALIAPSLFGRVIEYPAIIVMACLLRLPPVSTPNTNGQRALDWGLPLGLGLFALALAVWIPEFNPLSTSLRLALMFGLPAVLCYALADRPVRFALGLAAILLGGSFYAGMHGQTLRVERNFFGVLRVTRDPTGAFRRMVHGNTVHGRQFIDPARRCEPLSYYHRSGPLGQIFQVFDAKAGSTNVAVIGLGTGSMMCYSKPNQRWASYEINPAVVKLARDTNYFSFLENCATAPVRTILGDARLRLHEAPANAYDLIVLDAFSSDAIPMHLLTREAIGLYVSKLAPNGMLAFHISNRCLDLEPILGDLAHGADLVCLGQDENDPSESDAAAGKDASHWVVMARQQKDLGRLVKDGRWLPVRPRPRASVWTDDFSNVLSVFRWN